MPSRVHGIPDNLHEPIWFFPDDSAIKANPFYKSAKSGDIDAAVRLVSQLAFPPLIQLHAQLPRGLCFVAPHAREATGDNAIPQVLAQACAMLFDGEADTDIVQISRVFHTGADPMERMATRAEFEGLVSPGRSYVLIDDVTTMGGTLAELGNFIQSNGGNVRSALVLVNAGRLKSLRADPAQVRKLESRFKNEIEEILGVKPTALTANEANYLIGFRSADEIRDRLTKARKETDLRLRAKGIEREGGGYADGD
jgi:hypothetical protein